MRKLGFVILATVLLGGCGDEDSPSSGAVSRWQNDPVLSGVDNDALDRAAAGPAKKLCGFLDQPSAGNATLIDGDGEWIISMQGVYAARGDLPPVADIGDDTMFITANAGSYGYGCACLLAKTIDGGDDAERRIVEITQGNRLKLDQCRNIPDIVEPLS